MQNKATILVVDDTPANLAVVNEVLTAQGYDVVTAINGERAIKRLDSNLPDLILLDIQMPVMDGFETCRRIKADPAMAHIPIIFITALSDSASIANAFSLGAVDYISKPFQEAELIARVEIHLRLQGITQTLEHQVVERTQSMETAMQQLQGALTQLKTSQLQLVQYEKMSTIGNLVAGVAHEINNPLGFVKSNIPAVQQSVLDLADCLQGYRDTFPDPGEQITALLEDLEIDFVLEDLPKMLDSMKAGCDRIANISTSLRTFSRADSEVKVKANLHDGLNSTILILKYRLKANEHRPAIEIIRDYGNLPELECFPGQLNQVFMNVLANAIDMFDEMAQQTTYAALKNSHQFIKIQTAATADQTAIEIRIQDNGKGMSGDVRERIFDNLFTTKGVGQGTGLGLAISRQIVAEKHGGSLEVHSELGKGAEFCIRLPMRVGK